MAKKKKNKDKSFSKKAKETGRAIEHGAVEASRKIWLAGIGAYGMAYDVASKGANNATAQSAEMFEDLVKRGGELETDVMAIISNNPAVTTASKSVQKVADTSQKMQKKVRERFDARMERMRDLLGFGHEGSTADKLASKLEKLEDDVAAATKGALKKGDLMLKKRLSRLSDEIDAYVGDIDADEKPAKAKKKKSAKKAAKKKTVSKTIDAPAVKAPAPKAPAKAKAPAKVAPKPAKIVADDLTQINGVGPAMAKRLADEGVVSFGQLAVLDKDAAEALDAKIGGNGRLIRDAWVSQAKALATA